MKRIYLYLILSLLVPKLASSQCFGDRFKSAVFDTFQLDTGIIYGSNYGYDFQKGQTGTEKIDLAMDIYRPPASDTMTKRPMLLFIHGGSFIENNRKSAEILYMCETFAKHGYVTATMSYRLGIEAPVDSVNAFRMAFRAIQDGRAAVRFLRSKADDYGIDPERIFAGGTSAGAITGINMAYLNRSEEVPPYTDTSEHSLTNPKGLDGLLGKTNELYEYSSKIQGIINLAGATKTAQWMDDEDGHIPIISMHGDKDPTVPYGTDTIFFQGIPLLIVDGSYPIDKFADSIGVPSAFRTWCNAGHVPYYYLSGDSIAFDYMDSVMSFLNKHMYEMFLGCPEIEGLEENRPCIDGPEPEDTTSTHLLTTIPHVNIFPNPGSSTITIESDQEFEYDMLGVDGRMILQSQRQRQLNVSDFKPGVYLLHMKFKTHTLIRRLQVL